MRRSWGQQQSGRPRDEQGRPLLPNGQVDEAPDCYSVKRVSPGVFLIKHFADPDAREASCVFEARQSPEDVDLAVAEGIDVDIITLRRAQHVCNLADEEAIAS